jgi:anti-sigma factor RsiW
MSASCERILALLAAYHDGELDPPARAAVEEHLRACDACAAELSRIRAAALPLQALRNATPTPEQFSKFRAVVEEAADDGRTRRMAQSLAVMAASILIVGLAWLRVLAPAPPTSVTPPAVAARDAEPWEKVAVTLRADPDALPPTGENVAQSDVDFAEMMLQGLGGQKAER